MAYINGKKVMALLQKSAVTGVKGNAESSYRVGNVNITPANIGAVSSSELLDKIYPIGSIYMTTSATTPNASSSPASWLGGSWVRIKDRFLLAAGDSYTAGTSGGSATHTLTTDEMPRHGDHLFPFADRIGYGTAGKFLSGDVFSTYGSIGRGWYIEGNEAYPAGVSIGWGKAHNNMPPYLVVYMWKRTA